MIPITLTGGLMMTSAAPPEWSVALRSDRVAINGQSRILLCASLFYFRIPRACWRQRMEQLVSFGYNAIDVYFPWNYHESEAGVWEFEGEKDAAAFLELAAEVGLWVVARPGPYICSEWDGGALPAYLLKDGIRLRDNDPVYLGHVARWFDRIMPLLHQYELNRQGTVIAVQLENELDFYDCRDPQGYIRALRDMALTHGISIPLIACAGQGGLTAASGDVPGVVPTCNFYPDNRDPAFEDTVLTYRRMLEKRGLPLLVTETNRSHFLLRRLLSCGVKLLGPYLQVSGTDFGFTNATNNWGRPLAFMTSDYDFGGMISPEGHVRPEAYEGKLLRRILDVYGPSFAEAKPMEGEADSVPDPDPTLDPTFDKKSGPKCNSNRDPDPGSDPVFDSDFNSDFNSKSGLDPDFELVINRSLQDRGFTAGPYRLSFPDGGALAFVSNLTRELCLALPERMSLRRWGGIEGEIAYATAELFHQTMANGRLTLIFCAEESAAEVHIALRLHTPSKARLSGAVLSQDADITTLVCSGPLHARCEFDWPDGSGLHVIVIPRGDALKFASYDDASGTCNSAGPIEIAQEEVRELVKQWHAAPALLLGTQRISGFTKEGGQPPWPLEQIGIYRGFATFKADSGIAAPPTDRSCMGVLVTGASDIVSVYADQAYVGTVVPGGSSRYVAFPEPRAVSGWSGCIEIWGHSNFDDRRLPGLRLSSCKGVRDMAAVLAVRNLTSGWRFQRTADAAVRPEFVAAGKGGTAAKSVAGPNAGPNAVANAEATAIPNADASSDDSWPMTSFGGWHPNDPVAYEYYRRTIVLSEQADTFALHFNGLQSTVRVYIDGAEASVVMPDDPWLTLTPFVRPGGEHNIALILERRIGVPAGKVQLFESRSATNWRVAPVGETELVRAADQANLTATRTQFPIVASPGETVWLTGSLTDARNDNGWRVHAEGLNVKLTVLLGSRLIARLWLPGGSERPVMSGGSPDSFYVPGAWVAPDDPASSGIRILLESVVPGERGELRRLAFRPV